MQVRHNIRWYARLGARFFVAAINMTVSTKARLLDAIIAQRFESLALAPTS